MNEQDIAGGALDFLAGLVGRCCTMACGDHGGISYEVLGEAASRVRPGSNGVIVTPWLNGERTPVDDTTVRAGIHNLSTTTTFDDIARAFFEGVALNTRWSLHHLERFVGRKLDPITIVGGGGRSSLWCRIFADVLNRRIRQAKDPCRPTPGVPRSSRRWGSARFRSKTSGPDGVREQLRSGLGQP